MDIKFADRMQGITGSAIREIFKLLGKPGMISFAGGNPAPETFPAQKLSEISQKILAEKGSTVLQYGVTEGLMPLRETVAELMSENGVNYSADDVLITSGSTQGIELAVKALINPGDVILVENPTFLGSLQCFALHQARIIGVETDESGIITEDLLEKVKKYNPKILYAIPTFQNPAGFTTVKDRRRTIAEIAGEYDFFVLEDDPYRQLRYSGEDVPSIKSFDKNEKVISLFSFSKIISPGLRMGAVASHSELLKKMTVCKQSADVHCNILAQSIIDEYVRGGNLPGHIQILREDYARRMNTMLELLDDCLPRGSGYIKPDGGLFVWATLPEGYNALELFKIAVENNVAFVPGTHFYCGGGHENTLRLNFSMSQPEIIKKGMALLKRSVEQYNAR